MKRFPVWVVAAFFLAVAPSLAATVHERSGLRPGTEGMSDEGGKTLVAFNSMYGVDGPFLGSAFAVRGTEGDELPWEVREARGRLDTDGHLTIRIKGLVFKDEEGVPEGLRGINDESEFRAEVSCVTEEGSSVKTVNVVTDGFPATRSGDALIRTTVRLPNPCVEPLVLVLAGSEDKWFAVTGFESEEDEGEGH